MKKSFAFLVFALLAVSFIQISTVLAESGSDSGSGSDDSESSDDVEEEIEVEDELEDEVEVEDEMESETELEVEGNEVKFEQKTRINGVETKVKREFKDGVMKEEIKEKIRNASGEYEFELKREMRIVDKEEREQKMLEFKEKVKSRNGTIMVNEVKVRIEGLDEEEKEIIAGKINAKTGLNLSSEDFGNGTVGSMLRAYLSNGAYSEIKVLPDVAAARAVEMMKAKCEERNCTVELKETGEGNKTRAVYEVRTEKQARTLFIFKTKMKVNAEVDPETGEVLRTSKPWWAFLANEDDETEVESEVETETESESNETESEVEDITSTMPALDENVTETIVIENESELAAA